MDELDGAYVSAARRLGKYQHGRTPLQLPRHDQLLRVPAGVVAGRDGDAVGPDVVLGDDLGRMVSDGALVQQPCDAGERLAVMVPEDRVLRSRERQDETAAVAVLGDVAHAQLAALA